jgi:hypothetical protein
MLRAINGVLEATDVRRVLRHAGRTLRRAPGFTIVATLTVDDPEHRHRDADPSPSASVCDPVELLKGE